jgi:hypothetical protein
MSEDDKNKKPKDGETPLEEEKGKKIIHRMEVDRTPEIDSLHAELEKIKSEKETLEKAQVDEKKKTEAEKKVIEDELKEKKAILEKQSLDQLEKTKTEILDLAKKSKLSEEQISEIEKKLEDAKNVGLVKDMITMLASSIKEPPKTKPPPDGKASLTSPPSGEDGETFENKVAMIDELYKRAYYASQEYTKEQVDDAKKKIETLLKSLISGKSWQQMKDGQRLPAFKMIECPKCHGTILGEVPERCPYCKFNFAKTGDR